MEKKEKIEIIFLMFFIFIIPFNTNVKLIKQWDRTFTLNEEYCIQNNAWNPKGGFIQILNVDRKTGDFVIESLHFVGVSYPSVYKGNHWGIETKNSGMPIKLSNIYTAWTNWNVSVVDEGVWNVAYDIWIHQTNDYKKGAPNGAELMIWINYRGNANPSGQLVDEVNLEGYPWDVYFAKLKDWNYVAYKIKAENKTTNVHFNLNAFLKDSIERGYINKEWYLVSVEAGFEIFQFITPSHDKFESHNFRVYIVDP